MKKEDYKLMELECQSVEDANKYNCFVLDKYVQSVNSSSEDTAVLEAVTKASGGDVAKWGANTLVDNYKAGLISPRASSYVRNHFSENLPEMSGEVEFNRKKIKNIADLTESIREQMYWAGHDLKGEISVDESEYTRSYDVLGKKVVSKFSPHNWDGGDKELDNARININSAASPFPVDWNGNDFVIKGE